MNTSSAVTPRTPTGLAVLINFVAFQVAWLACVVGGARDSMWLGPVAAALAIALHLALSDDRAGEARLVLGAGVLGAVADTAQVAAGAFTFVHGPLPHPLTQPYMVALWMAFATTFRVSLRWLSGRLALAAFLGATLGPLSYWAGVRLGAIRLGPSIATSLVIIGLAWLIAMPALVWLSDTLRARTAAAPAPLAGASAMASPPET